jgi:hypothetical protein
VRRACGRGDMGCSPLALAGVFFFKILVGFSGQVFWSGFLVRFSRFFHNSVLRFSCFLGFFGFVGWLFSTKIIKIRNLSKI